MGATFAFASVRPGSEAWLRADVAREQPELRPAFSRPGLITFKSERPLTPEVRLRSPFARAVGLSLGAAKTVPEIVDRVVGAGATRLHVWQRVAPKDAEHNPVGPLACEVRASLLAAIPGLPADEKARDHELVADVIVAEGEPALVGVHLHTPDRIPWAGGRIPLDEPRTLPSRAYRKMAEGLIWSRAPISRGEVVLEFGCSPGGSSLALLERGALVVGVDPEPVRPEVLAYGDRFVHVARPMGGLPRSELPEGVRWIAMDVSIAPQVALHSLQRFLPPYKRTLRGLLLTLKMNDDKVVAELPRLVDRVRELGMVEVRVTQLPSNRREVFCFARTALP